MEIRKLDVNDEAAYRAYQMSLENDDPLSRHVRLVILKPLWKIAERKKHKLLTLIIQR